MTVSFSRYWRCSCFVPWVTWNELPVSCCWGEIIAMSVAPMPLVDVTSLLTTGSEKEAFPLYFLFRFILYSYSCSFHVFFSFSYVMIALLWMAVSFPFLLSLLFSFFLLFVFKSRKFRKLTTLSSTPFLQSFGPCLERNNTSLLSNTGCYFTFLFVVFHEKWTLLFLDYMSR